MHVLFSENARKHIEGKVFKTVSTRRLPAALAHPRHAPTTPQRSAILCYFDLLGSHSVLYLDSRWWVVTGDTLLFLKYFHVDNG